MNNKAAANQTLQPSKQQSRRRLVLDYDDGISLSSLGELSNQEKFGRGNKAQSDLFNTSIKSQSNINSEDDSD